ncbi:hypothetical protein Ga0100231_015810 [Opitutaceae bacterium TAV4]|nr:hypothetical protein Ga0100231_015810 [Opitutaceae bacterium TAV4]
MDFGLDGGAGVSPAPCVAQASRLQSSLLREAPHSIKVTALRAINKIAGGTPALHRNAGVVSEAPTTAWRGCLVRFRFG